MFTQANANANTCKASSSEIFIHKMYLFKTRFSAISFSIKPQAIIEEAASAGQLHAVLSCNGTLIFCETCY